MTQPSSSTPEDGEVRLNPGEKTVDLERSGWRIIQSDGSFRFGMDAVLLSDFACVRAGETAVDLGTGTGILPILLCAKTKGEHFVGIEIDPKAADMAARSVALNGLSDRIEIICADIREIKRGEDKKLKNLRGRAGVVVTNPPYIKAGAGLLNPDESVAAARHETSCTLLDVCEAAGAILPEAGRFYMVHRPSRLPEIMEMLRSARLEPKRLRMVHPYLASDANMVLIEAVKGAGSECRTESPLIVYDAPGRYSQEICRIYGF